MIKNYKFKMLKYKGEYVVGCYEKGEHLVAQYDYFTAEDMCIDLRRVVNAFEDSGVEMTELCQFYDNFSNVLEDVRNANAKKGTEYIWVKQK